MFFCGFAVVVDVVIVVPCRFPEVSALFCGGSCLVRITFWLADGKWMSVFRRIREVEMGG